MKPCQKQALIHELKTLRNRSVVLKSNNGQDEWSPVSFRNSVFKIQNAPKAKSAFPHTVSLAFSEICQYIISTYDCMFDELYDPRITNHFYFLIKILVCFYGEFLIKITIISLLKIGESHLILYLYNFEDAALNEFYEFFKYF